MTLSAFFNELEVESNYINISPPPTSVVLSSWTKKEEPSSKKASLMSVTLNCSDDRPSCI